MNAILEAIAKLITDWGWLLVLMMLLGGGDALGRALSGRRANAKLKAKLYAVAAENANLQSLLDKVLDRSPGATLEPTDRAQLLMLLNQVLAADLAYPQLPRELRDNIEAVVARELEGRPQRWIDPRTDGKKKGKGQR